MIVICVCVFQRRGCACVGFVHLVCAEWKITFFFEAESMRVCDWSGWNLTRGRE